MKNKQLDFSKIKMLVMDVDGIMTDGGMFFAEDGEMVKRFNALDGFGLKMLVESGIKVGIISFNISNVIKYRTNALGIHKVLTGIREKGKALLKIAEEFELSLEEIVYMGDDRLDLPAIKLAGISVTVPNAADEVKQCADMITSKRGGYGAVREVCDCILKAQNGKLKTLGVVPARYKSKRFEGKALAPIDGLPMIVRVCKRAEQSILDKIIVATDDERIVKVCRDHNIDVQFTSEMHTNGSERVWEVAENYDADVVVNIQGDEPLLEAATINRLIAEFKNNPFLDMATAMVKEHGTEHLHDENLVKVVVDKNGFALYFSRQALALRSGNGDVSFNKHIGIYAYSKDALRKYCSFESSEMERAESLEQLRALENGFKIKVVEVDQNAISVNVPGDISKVEEYLRKN